MVILTERFAGLTQILLDDILQGRIRLLQRYSIDLDLESAVDGGLDLRQAQQPRVIPDSAAERLHCLGTRGRCLTSPVQGLS